MTENAAKGVRWDLKDLYASPKDPQIESDLRLAESKAISFQKKFKPYFEDKNNVTLPIAELLEEYKIIVTLMTKPGVFAQLSFAEQTNNPAIGAFLQKIQVTLTEISSYLIFFDVCWNQLDKKAVEKILDSPHLQKDRHFLEKMRAYAPYTLNEGEEKIMAIKANTSGDAFSRLFDEIMNNIPFYLEENGQRSKKTEGEVLSLFHSPDRQQRIKASDSLTEGLKSNSHLITYIYNMILADQRASLKIRNYKHPMDARNLSNEIDHDSVRHLIRSVKDAYPIANRYYHLKKKILGLDKLYDYDRYASVNSEESPIAFTKCKEIVLSGYEAFSPEAANIVRQFFEKRWIDAEIREGKQGGGFCCQTTPDLHPYILVNYTGSLRDVMTVAHELGHGIHQFLAKKAGILESGTPLTMAETASVFGEILIFEKILEGEKDARKRLALLCGKIDDNFATVYRQIALTDFELLAHETGLKEGELSSEQLNDFWIQANAPLYGDSVELTDNYRHAWKHIPHFFHSPFYCYAYSFAQLFVLCLYQKYKEDKKAFVPRYFQMLELGGSQKPEVIAKIAGFDIHDPQFWQSGIRFLDTLVQQAESLARVL